ncbi:MAG: hypothetical protein V4611_03910 [Patescibacteria group bacterium]
MTDMHNNSSENYEIIEIAELRAIEARFDDMSEDASDVRNLLHWLADLDKALWDPEEWITGRSASHLTSIASLEAWEVWSRRSDHELHLAGFTDVIASLVTYVLNGAGIRPWMPNADETTRESVHQMGVTGLLCLLSGKYDVLSDLLDYVDRQIVKVNLEIVRLTRKLSRDIARVRRLNLELTTEIFSADLTHLQAKNQQIYKLEQLNAVREYLVLG